MDRSPFTDPTQDPSREDARERLTAALLERALSGELEQGLLDVAERLGAIAVALWRPVRAGTESAQKVSRKNPSTWRPVRSRGPYRALPKEDLVVAFLEGDSRAQPPGDVFLLGGGPLGLGLAVAGLDAASLWDGTEGGRHERSIDFLASLLLLAARVEAAQGETSQGIGNLPTLLPGQANPDLDAPR